MFVVGAALLLWVGMEAVPEAPSPLNEAPAMASPSLAWSAPSECPQERDGQDAFERAMAGRKTEPFQARVTITRAAIPGYELRLRTVMGTWSGERALFDEDCATLARAAMLVLTMMALEQVPSKPVPPPITPISTTKSAPPPPRSTAIGLDISTAWGLLPRTAEGVGLRFSHDRTRFGLFGRVTAWREQQRDLSLLPGASAHFDLMEGALGVGARAENRWGIQAGVGTVLSRLHGRSEGVSAPGESSAWWCQPFAEASLSRRLGARFRVRLVGEGRGLIPQPRFAIAGLGEIYRPDAFAFRMGLGLEGLL